ncbi:MAG: DNA-3-methyladenine glycosylase family protein [Eisenbergiella sp.]
MVVKKITNFSLEQIARSGQCFRMSRREDGFFDIISGSRWMGARQSGESCEFLCTEEEFSEFWEDYFDLKQNYGEYISRIDKEDVYLNAAVKLAGGVRILRQDIWEMIVSFLISQQNNIVRIRRCIENICEAYGNPMKSGRGEVYFTFPEPEALAGLEEDALKACNLGYRSKYVVRAARSVAEGCFDLEQLGTLPYEKAKEELLKLFGVGVKVADCICLFGLHHLEAFPVDTHISQALKKYYGDGFPMEKYRGIQGVIQQYIFYYELWGDSQDKG